MKGQIKRKLRKKWQYNESIPEKSADLKWPSGRMHRSVFWWFDDIERLNSDRNSKSLLLHSQSILFVRKTAAEQASRAQPSSHKYKTHFCVQAENRQNDKVATKKSIKHIEFLLHSQLRWQASKQVQAQAQAPVIDVNT